MEYEQYVAERHRALCRFAGVLSGDPALAEDLVAEVLARAFEQWERVCRADHPHAYVRRMVLNEYLHWRRRTARTTVLADVEELATPTSDHADQQTDRAALARELRQLPAKQRAALVLRFYEGLSTREIADLLGTREVTVRSNISRALHTLRIQFDDEPTADVAGNDPAPAARRTSR